MDVVGIKETLGNLKQFGDDLRIKWLKDALRAGGRQMLNSAVMAAPKKGGLTAESIKLKLGKKPRGWKGIYRYVVAISKKWVNATFKSPKAFGGSLAKVAGIKGSGNDDKFYMAFVEFGHKTRPKDGSPGHEVPGKHWFEKCFKHNAEAVVTTIINRLSQLIAKESKKAYKRSYGS
jgi:hypothetical protein